MEDSEKVVGITADEDMVTITRAQFEEYLQLREARQKELERMEKERERYHERKEKLNEQRRQAYILKKEKKAAAIQAAMASIPTKEEVVGKSEEM